MSGIYYADMLAVLSSAGCSVSENDITAGWQSRARSSGGFPSPPLAVFMHHTASSTTPANDLAYMIDGSPDAPVGNVLLDRTGTYWPVAAGASNCAGKGGPSTFSRGTIPLDSGNTRGFQIEAANNGVGEQWPKVQVDAFIAGANALNAHFGNLPTDVITHALGSGDGYTDRKIDPATAASVEGSWRPASANNSGTWLLVDVRAECSRRAGSSPPPPSTPTEGTVIDMYTFIVTREGWPAEVVLTVAPDGVRWNQFDITGALDRLVKVPEISISKDQLLGVLGDRPGIGACPFAILPEYADADLAAAW